MKQTEIYEANLTESTYLMRDNIYADDRPIKPMNNTNLFETAVDPNRDQYIIEETNEEDRPIKPMKNNNRNSLDGCRNTGQMQLLFLKASLTDKKTSDSVRTA